MATTNFLVVHECGGNRIIARAPLSVDEAHLYEIAGQYGSDKDCLSTVNDGSDAVEIGLRVRTITINIGSHARIVAADVAQALRNVALRIASIQ